MRSFSLSLSGLLTLTLAVGVEAQVLQQPQTRGTTRDTIPAYIPPAPLTDYRGVTVYVNGRRRLAPGPIVKPRRIEINNGIFRLTWYPELCEPAAFEGDTRDGDRWLPATARCLGDWLYPGGPVKTQPTSIELVRIDSAGAELRMRFGDHWIRPRSLGFPSWYQDQPYPFVRTVWLRAGETGYFTRVELERLTYFPYPDIEHEVGFGGLWGPARIRTSQVDYQTQDQEHTLKHNLERRVDAAEFIRDGAQVYRVLVPLSANPMISPRFPNQYGGVYVYAIGPISIYGAYMYAAPLASALPARAICRFAWTRVPFTVPRVSNAELDACGPTPPAVRPGAPTTR